MFKKKKNQNTYILNVLLRFILQELLKKNSCKYWAQNKHKIQFLYQDQELEGTTRPPWLREHFWAAGAVKGKQTYLDIVKRHNVFMLQLLMKNRENENKCITRGKRVALAKPLSNADFSDDVWLCQWGVNKAHLEDFDLFAKQDLRLGQVLLIDAFDGHFPVCLLYSRKTRSSDLVWGLAKCPLITGKWRTTHFHRSNMQDSVELHSDIWGIYSRKVVVW